MRVLFVRHGESTFNVTRRFQTKDVPLTERGKIQAHLAARCIKDTFPAEAVIASDMWRAQQTAEIIESVLDLEAEYWPELRELRRPSNIIGKRVYDPRTFTATISMLTRGRNGAYRYRDEETIAEMRERARSVLARLVARPESNVVVISHETFIKAALEAMTIAADAQDITAYRLFRPFLILRNASMTECQWDGKWRINYVNRTGHLRQPDVPLIPR